MSLRVIHLILSSYQKTYDENLLGYPLDLHPHVQNTKNLFTLQKVVIAHNFEKDPCLNYANAVALQLWGRHWEEMIGMPSRLTAPKEELKQRQYVLKEVTKKNQSKIIKA